MTDAYQTKVPKLSGTDYKEISRKARDIYRRIASKTKRKPYVRSIYFKKEKVFLDYFWQHLQQKNWRDRFRRLQYYPCAIDLIVNNQIAPVVVKNPNNHSERLYRFTGITKQKELFVVQIKESIKKRDKHFISVYPQ